MTAKKRESSHATGPGQGALLDAMHEIWLAGVGAFARAQKDGPKVLEQLLAEGVKVYGAARPVAEKLIRDAIGQAQNTLGDRIGDVRTQAGDTLENLEKMFQTRVHRALNQLGVPSADEIAALSRRVDELNANVERLVKRGARAAGRAPAAKRKAGGARRKAAKKKAGRARSAA
jgi:poly(hydroxyalkanoate) granule-associated protein